MQWQCCPVVSACRIMSTSNGLIWRQKQTKHKAGESQSNNRTDDERGAGKTCLVQHEGAGQTCLVLRAGAGVPT
eukprot:255795-Karenia_brevis.AAC.1